MYDDLMISLKVSVDALVWSYSLLRFVCVCVGGV